MIRDFTFTHSLNVVNTNSGHEPLVSMSHTTAVTHFQFNMNAEQAKQLVAELNKAIEKCK